MSFRITRIATATPTVDDWFIVSQLSTITYTATTISAAASDNSLNDSALNFLSEGFTEGQSIQISGFTGATGNNYESATILSVTAGKIVLKDDRTIADDAAGESVTITAWRTRRAQIADIIALIGVDASDVTFTPADNTDWTSSADPGNVDDALDQLASRLTTAEAGGGGITALTGDVTASGTGSVAATIANDAVTYAKMQDVTATSRVLGRKTVGGGDPEECTLSEILDFIGSAAQGDILYRGASGWARLAAGTNGYVLTTGGAGANPAWAAASGGVSDGDKGDITVSGSGATWTVDNNVVTNAKVADMANSTIKGRTTSGSGDPEDLTAAQAAAIVQGDGLTVDLCGFRGVPQNSQSANYTLVAADAGKHLLHPAADANDRTFTIPSNASVAYPVGTTVTFVNTSANVLTIAITSDNMYLAGADSTGSRSLAQYGVATAVKISSTSWIISGVGLS